MIKREKPPLLSLWEFNGSSLNKIESHSTKDALCQVWLKLAHWFWRRRFFNFVNVFSLFLNYLPLEKGGTLHLNKTESPSPKDTLCQVWLKLTQWFWRRRFWNFVNVFSLFRNYLPLDESRVLHLKKLEFPSPDDALCQVWLNMAQWFWKRRFFNFGNVFSLFINYLPLEKDRALHLNKSESPSYKDALCQVWSSGSWEEDVYISSIHFRYFLIISPWKRARPFIWRNLNPLHPRMFCAKFGWNWPSGSWEEVENRKSLQTDGHTDGQTDRQTTDERRSEKLTWAFRSGELKSVDNNSSWIIPK